MRISDWSSDVCSSDLYFGNRGRHVVDIAAVKGGYADASAADGIYAVLVAQAVYLLCGKPRIREHAALGQDEIEILGDAVCFQLFDQLNAHGAYAFTHGRQLAGP